MLLMQASFIENVMEKIINWLLISFILSIWRLIKTKIQIKIIISLATYSSKISSTNLVMSILISRYSYWIDQSLPSFLYSILTLFRSLSSLFSSILLWNCPTLIKADLQISSIISLIRNWTFLSLNFWLLLIILMELSQGKTILSILVFSIISDRQLINNKLWILISDSKKLLYFFYDSGMMKCSA